MSYTALYAARGADAAFHKVGEYRNSHGSGPMIWDALCRKYLREEMQEAGTHYPFDFVDELVRYENRGDFLQPWELNALRATYERAVVLRNDLLTCADSLYIFAEAHRTPGRSCSLREQWADIRTAYLAGALAVAWYQTSLSDNWLHRRSELDEDHPDWVDEPNPIKLSQPERYKVQPMVPLVWAPTPRVGAAL